MTHPQYTETWNPARLRRTIVHQGRGSELKERSPLKGEELFEWGKAHLKIGRGPQGRACSRCASYRFMAGDTI